jgi:hypothetical protein
MRTATTNQPIACTLQGGTYADRLAWIAQLARDGLCRHERRDLILELRYAPAVIARVPEMVRREQECCAFLTFDVEERGDEVRVTIAAPERARDPADLVFEPFLPPTDHAAPLGVGAHVLWRRPADMPVASRVTRR